MNDATPTGRRPGRRDVLALGAGIAVGAAGMGIAWSASSDDGSGAGPAPGEAPTTEAPAAPEALRFVSSQLTAPRTEVWRRDGAAVAAGLLFTTPRTPTFRGVVYDDEAQPVWIEPDGSAATDLRVQTYRGRPVLTYWTGEIKEGTGNGKGVVLDERYLPVAEVRCGHGVLADIHEFQLTSRGTALVTSYPTLPYDLTPVGGPADGFVWGGRLQEVDVETGEVLLDWEGLDHIDLTETYREVEDTGTAALPFDPIHVNSIEEDGDALLISARHTSALYRIDRRTGEVLWRFGGRKATSRCPTGASSGGSTTCVASPTARSRSSTTTTTPPRPTRVSAALRFELDEGTMTATPRAGAAVPGPLRLRDGQRPAPRRRARARRVGDGSLRHRVRRRRARRSSSCPGSGSAPTGPTASRGAGAR